MRKLFLAAVGAAFLMAGPAQAGTLRLNIDGIRPLGGQVLVAVQTKEQFMLPINTAAGIVDGNTDGRATLELPVPDGEYSVLIMHDADNSFDLKMDDRGVPLEGVASGHGPLNGYPAFELVKVPMKGDTTLTTKMIYPE